MDPTRVYLDMYYAMRDGDHETARKLAVSLKEWFDKDGFYPPNYAEIEVKAYLLSVLRRTVYLTFE